MADEPEVWSGDEIEEAYQKALSAIGDVAWADEPAAPATAPVEVPPGARIVADGAELAAPQAAVDGNSVVGPSNGHGASSASEVEPTTIRLAAGTDRHQPVAAELHSHVTAAQIIEAALFVGGWALSAKKFCSLLRGSFDAAFVEQTIDELNDQYAAEARPYEIRLGEGGYRLELRAEHEKLRQRVYGAAPREVKLSQDVLEVLALVAYQQPISQQEVESHGKQNAGNVLRQLLRRDLVALERGAGGRKDVKYLTTPRFLSVFGLASLDELPQPDDVARK